MTLDFESGAHLLDLFSWRSYPRTEMAPIFCHLWKVKFCQAGKETLGLNWYQAHFATGKGRSRTGARLSFFPVTWEARSSRAVVATSANLAFQDSDVENVCYSWQFWLNSKSALTQYKSLVPWFWKKCGRQEEWIREGKGSFEKGKYLCCSTYHVTLIVIPITWLN